ncbi:MAG: hypothetical protein ACNI25_05605 [Halarcobacter sp.]
MQDNQTLDKWEESLEEVLLELKKCQEEKFGVQSCKSQENFCENFFDCELRKKYVLAVYESMSKGAGGGFEF